MYKDPSVAIFVVSVLFLCVVLVLIKDKNSSSFLKSFIYLLIVIILLNLIFLIRTLIGWN
ncbi:hypothetical protein C9446_11705 [Providencia heimbachae]|nr:hypothetical protein C9446_11705 [Providencia heimbachae]